MMQTNIPSSALGGTTVGFVNKEDAKKLANLQDVSTLSGWFEEDPREAYLGLVTTFQNRFNQSYSMITELWDRKQILEVDSLGTKVTWDTPIYKDTGIYTEKDFSYQKYAGVDDSTFKIALNRKFSVGDKLTYDMEFGEEIYVFDEEVRKEGSAWIHTVKLVTDDPAESFPSEKLGKGIEYFKTGHGAAEFDTTFSGFNYEDSMSYMKHEMQLGSPTGVEAFITAQAERTFAGAVVDVKNFVERLKNEASALGEYTVLFGKDAIKVGKDGKKKIDWSKTKISSTMQYLVLRELEKLVAIRLIHGKGGTVRGKNGIVRFNEGLLRAARRGYRILYGRPGGITINHLSRLSNYVFQVSDKSYEERELVITAGTRAFDNITEILLEQLSSQMEKAKFLYGSESQLPQKVLSGKDNQHLEFKSLRVVGGYVPGVGNVKVIKDTSLDRTVAKDRFSKGMHGNAMSHTTYSAIIWDVTSSESSNVEQNVKGANLIEGGKGNANIYIVKPKGSHIFYGKEQGRWSSTEAKDIVSSNKYMGEGYWAWAALDVIVLNSDRIAMIELDEKARAGFR
jgi:hypothetical protein